MSDRTEQARAEAERQYPGNNGLRSGDEWASIDAFMRGWLTADANPKPRAITRSELNEAAMSIADLLPARGTPAYVLIETALRTLWIEVEDDDE